MSRTRTTRAQFPYPSQTRPPLPPLGRRRTLERATPAAARIPALDGLRGMAILLVMTFHAYQVTQGLRGSNQNWIDRVGNQVAMVGWIGVDLFFVLSGFLITGILWDSRSRPNYFRVFYLRRGARIIPLYYAFLAIYFGVLPHLLGSGHFLVHGADAQIWNWSYLTNVRVSLSGWEGISPHLHHFWSLAMEGQFYLLWPLAVFFLPRRGIMGCCLVMIGLSLAGRVAAFASGEPTIAYTLTPMRMDSLAAGSWVALAMREPAWRQSVVVAARKAFLPLGLGLAALGVWRGSVSGYDPVIGTVGLTGLALFFAALVVRAVSVTVNGQKTHLLETPALLGLGKYSYGLYVFHLPLMLFLGEFGIASRLFEMSPGPVVLKQAAFAFLSIGLSCAAAWLSWRLIERPFLRWVDHLTGLLRAHPQGVNFKPRRGSGLYRTGRGNELRREQGSRFTRQRRHVHAGSIGVTIQVITQSNSMLSR